MKGQNCPLEWDFHYRGKKRRRGQLIERTMGKEGVSTGRGGENLGARQKKGCDT